ncbi:uncharacterized protein LOC111324212 [Stylophora pistillata]|uniref:uncharacterized protein LOC111324212 n=1 Tax=Stylophora pistillata TaxID=50429 RepID=UPI000C0507B4|nr:uncharacterized protein LOC111324212 [Stylophora pistillata]
MDKAIMRLITQKTQMCCQFLIDLNANGQPHRQKRYSTLWDRWQNHNLKYYLTNGEDMSASDQARVIAKALKMWSDVTPLRFTRICQPLCTTVFDGMGDTFSHAFSLRNGRIHFDDDETSLRKEVSGVNPEAWFASLFTKAATPWTYNNSNVNTTVAELLQRAAQMISDGNTQSTPSTNIPVAGPSSSVVEEHRRLFNRQLRVHPYANRRHNRVSRSSHRAQRIPENKGPFVHYKVVADSKCCCAQTTHVPSYKWLSMGLAIPTSLGVWAWAELIFGPYK